MTTWKQIAANRLNAQRSTGPTTAKGKAAVRQNAFRHGFCSKIPRLSDESDDDIQHLLSALVEEYRPVGIGEEILVYKMAQHFFFQQRAANLLARKLDGDDPGSQTVPEVGLMLRYHAQSDRGFAKALADLRNLQKERMMMEIGFVPYFEEAEDPQAQEEPQGSSVPPTEAPSAAPAGAPKVAPTAVSRETLPTSTLTAHVTSTPAARQAAERSQSPTLSAAT